MGILIYIFIKYTSLKTGNIALSLPFRAINRWGVAVSYTLKKYFSGSVVISGG